MVTLDPAALGYPVTAFVTLKFAQGRGRSAVTGHLASIPEVLEVHTITGSANLMVRFLARSNADLAAGDRRRGAGSDGTADSGWTRRSPAAPARWCALGGQLMAVRDRRSAGPLARWPAGHRAPVTTR